MTKTETKLAAQNRLMSAMQTAFSTQPYEADLTNEQIAAMDAQFSRIEKLLGYEQGSWARGC